MIAASKKTVALGSLMTLALFAAIPLAQGHHAYDARGDLKLARAPVFAGPLRSITAEEFESRWSGREVAKIEARLPQGDAATTPAKARPTVETAPARVQTAGVKGDRLTARSAACEGQAWPHIAPDCIVDAGSARAKAVRTITIEHRPESNTSVLARTPVATALRQ